MSSAESNLFPLGPDTTPYRKLDVGGVKTVEAGGRTFIEVAPEAIRALAKQAMIDINHLLRPGHLKQLAAILDDPEATPNDRFVAYDLLKNAMAVPADVQHLVDYWLYRNHRRIETTRRELQVAQMVMVLTSDGVRRARSHAMRQLDDCMHLLEILQGVPLDLGATSRDRLSTQRKKARLSR